MEAQLPMRQLGMGIVAWVLILASATLASATARAEPTKDECFEADESAQGFRMGGRLREAQERLSTCVAQSCPWPVRDDCSERLNEVLKALPTVVFDVRGPGEEAHSQVLVKMDGALIARKIDGAAVAVDPGLHVFTFEADGFLASQQTLLVLEGGKGRVVSVALRPDPHRVHTSAARIGAFAALGVGAVGVGVGCVFGLRAMLDKATLAGACSGNACPARAQPEIGALHSDGSIADVAFGVGIFGLAAGAVLWIVSSGSRKPEKAASYQVAPWVGARTAGLEARF